MILFHKGSDPYNNLRIGVHSKIPQDVINSITNQTLYNFLNTREFFVEDKYLTVINYIKFEFYSRRGKGRKNFINSVNNKDLDMEIKEYEDKKYHAYLISLTDMQRIYAYSQIFFPNAKFE